MSIACPCPYSDDWEHCKYEKYYGQPILAKCSSCDRCKKEVKNIYINEDGKKNVTSLAWHMNCQKVGIGIDKL